MICLTQPGYTPPGTIASIETINAFAENFPALPPKIRPILEEILKEIEGPMLSLSQLRHRIQSLTLAKADLDTRLGSQEADQKSLNKECYKSAAAAVGIATFPPLIATGLFAPISIKAGVALISAGFAGTAPSIYTCNERETRVNHRNEPFDNNENYPFKSTGCLRAPCTIHDASKHLVNHRIEKKRERIANLEESVKKDFIEVVSSFSQEKITKLHEELELRKQAMVEINSKLYSSKNSYIQRNRGTTYFSVETYDKCKDIVNAIIAHVQLFAPQVSV